MAPTGSGKTVIARAIIKQTIEAFQDVLVLAHRREIIAPDQPRSCTTTDIAHGIIQAGLISRGRWSGCRSHRSRHCTARAIRTERMELPPADLLVIDEAHHCPAQTYRKIIEAYPDAIAARPDGNAMPRRRPRARRHIRDDDRMPAGRRADRAAAIWSGRASMRRSIPI